MNYADTLAEVRAISEGRAIARKAQPVQAAPIIPQARPVPVPAAPEPERHYGQMLGNITLSAALEIFRKSNPGEFTARRAAAAMTLAGWNGGERAMANVCQKLRNLWNLEQVDEIRREKTSPTSSVIIWKFKA